jgi:hypothetical protein
MKSTIRHKWSIVKDWRVINVKDTREEAVEFIVKHNIEGAVIQKNTYNALEGEFK